MPARVIAMMILALALMAAPAWADSATATAVQKVGESATATPSHAEATMAQTADETESVIRNIEDTVWFQGFVADPGTGEPINGSVSVLARIYDSEYGGASLWGPETHAGTQVTDGWFNIELGSIVSPLPAFDDPPYYLQIMINGETLSPRLKLASVPSAFQSGGADEGADEDWYMAGNDVYRLTGNVGIGVAMPEAKLHVDGSTAIGGLFRGSGTEWYAPLRANNTAGSATAFTSGVDPGMFWYTVTPTAVFGHADGTGDGALFESMDSGIGARVFAHGTGDALQSSAASGRSGYFSGGNGVEINGKVVAYSNDQYSLHVTGTYPSGSASVIKAEYLTSGPYDADAVRGVCVPADYWGYGGYFTGGYKGVYGSVSPTGGSTYYGAHGLVSGGTGTNYGVYGYAAGSGVNYGVYGYVGGSGTKYAGYFSGNAHVTGTFTAGVKSFKIDHPLDPANKYLLHSCVESDDMMNVYNGNIELDDAGEAWVELSDWFEALNGDYRYQLTCIGGFAPVYIAEKISGNRFKIAGGEPGMEVSWQVTGIRHDELARAARVTVEQDKPMKERGKYLYPEAFGLPASMGVDYENNSSERK